MIKLDIALRYAKVLFNLHPNELKEWMAYFENISIVFRKNKNFLQFLHAPQIEELQKKEILEKTLSSTFSSEFLQFLLYLITKKHLKYLPAITDKYRDLFNQKFDTWEAVMVVPSAIDGDLEKKVTEKLESFFHKKIKINKKINPSILGGAILLMGDTMIDLSIAGRLKKMKESLLKHDI